MKKIRKMMATFLLTGFMSLAIMILAPQVSMAALSFSGLGFLEGTSVPSSNAQGISQDGTTVVGIADTDGGEYSFRWTEDGGMEKLGRLSRSVSSAYAVSADGLRVVGRTSTSYGSTAYLWTDIRMQIV